MKRRTRSSAPALAAVPGARAGVSLLALARARQRWLKAWPRHVRAARRGGVVALCQVLLVVLTANAWAESPEALAERRSIQRQRAEAETQFESAARECQSRFAVTACVDELRARKRETLAALRAREIELDDAKRREEADAARSRREEKKAAKRTPQVQDAASAQRGAASAARGVPHPLPQRNDAQRNDGVAREAAAKAQQRQERAAAHRQKAADEAADAAERAAAQQQRAARAAAHRERVEQRNAERAAAGKRAAPLPVPAAASASSP